MTNLSGFGGAEPDPGTSPAPAQPAQGPPPAAAPSYSAAAYPTPVAPYPQSAAPYPTAIMPAVTPRLSPWIWVLAGVAAALLLAVGGVGMAYANARSANADEVAQRDAQIADLRQRLQQLEDERPGLEADRDEAEAALEAAQAQVRDHEACPDALLAFLETEVDSPEEDVAFDAMLAICNVRL